VDVVTRLLAAGCLSAGCGGERSDSPRQDATSNVPVHGGTAVIATGQEPESLIPYGIRSQAATRVQSFLFGMLANTNEDLVSFGPWLARDDWEWSDDRKQLTMHLRDDIYWTDGVQVTAEDVRFSWEVARDSVVGWRSAHWKRRVGDCEIVDRFTVRFHFDDVFFEQFRFAKEGFIVPKHLLEDVPREQWRSCDFARQPIGCGPFKLQSWEPGQRIVLVRNDNYFDKPKPYLERVVIEFVPEPSTRVGRLRAGSVDLVAAPELPLRDAAELRDAYKKGQGEVKVFSCRGRGYDFIGYNARDPLFASAAVREALTRAIDRQQIVDALCFGFAEVFEGPIAPILWAYDPSQPQTPYDPKGAKRLLAEEGWSDSDGDGWLDKNGERFEFRMMTNNDNALRMQAIIPVQAYWRDIGVKVELESYEMQTALSLREQGKSQAYYGGWNAGLSPAATLEGIWSCEARTGRWNFVQYCNPKVDSLTAAAGQMVEAAESQPLFHAIQRLVSADHPYTWMYYDHSVSAHNERLRGVVIDQRGVFLNMEEWYIPTAMQTAGR
jgi:peptide/nickel transport system substrate-binding protein